jgi:hypothetical protein
MLRDRDRAKEIWLPRPALSKNYLRSENVVLGIHIDMATWGTVALRPPSVATSDGRNQRKMHDGRGPWPNRMSLRESLAGIWQSLHQREIGPLEIHLTELLRIAYLLDLPTLSLSIISRIIKTQNLRFRSTFNFFFDDIVSCILIPWLLAMNLKDSESLCKPPASCSAEQKSVSGILVDFPLAEAGIDAYSSDSKSPGPGKNFSRCWVFTHLYQ